MLYKWYQHNNLDKDVVIGITKTGYANDDIALEQLQHFINHTKNKKRGIQLLFIIISYSLYMTIPFHNITTENKIVLFHLPTHLIYLTQTLNIGVFQLFKHYYIDTIDITVQL